MVTGNNSCAEWSRYYQDNNLPGLDVLHARFIDHRYARHAHDYFVVALVESGAASYWYRGAERTASAGQAFVINPDEPHTGEPAMRGGYVYRVLYPRAEHVSRVVADIGTGNREPFFQESVLQDRHLAAMLSNFHRLFAKKAPAIRTESLLLEVLEHLLTHHSDSQLTTRKIGAERPAVKTAREYIQAHFDQDVSIFNLAKLVSLSPYYFAHAFQREIGLPPHAYLDSVRIQKARQLLDKGHTVVSAALSTGYADQSHFSHRFKRLLGITPGQYIRKGKIRQDWIPS